MESVLIKRPNRRRLNERERTAYHEAGHAVAFHVFERPFQYVTIKPREGSLGHIRNDSEVNPVRFEQPNLENEDDLRLIESRIMCILAGEAATHYVEGKRDPGGAGRAGEYLSGDARDVLDYLLRLLSCGENPEAPENKAAVAYEEWLWFRIGNVLARRWSLVETLAAALLKRETLTYEHCKRLIEEEQERLMPGANALVARLRRPRPLHHTLAYMLVDARGGASRSEFAEKAGVSVSTLRKLEEGGHDVRLSTLLQICTKLDWSISIGDESG